MGLAERADKLIELDTLIEKRNEIKKNMDGQLYEILESARLKYFNKKLLEILEPEE